jgi:Arc/MetJ family transcription regulator
MKTVIDVNEEALALAAKDLGTTTRDDTVNAALEFVANRQRRIEQLLADPDSLGVGRRHHRPDVMRQARTHAVPLPSQDDAQIATMEHSAQAEAGGGRCGWRV